MTDARQVTAEVTRRLQAAEVPGATADARWIVAHVLRTSPAGLAFAGPVSEEEIAQIEAATTRRSAREPLQHILGSAPFGDLELAVGPGVLVPRSETEVLAQYVLTWLRQQDHRPLHVVDACAGSGALALAVACHAPPGTQVTAIEKSVDALPWLHRNVAACAPRFQARGSTVEIVAGDVTVPDRWPTDQDLVVSNPPYIPDGCIPREPEVRDHDPAVALFGGPDGFTVLRPLLTNAASVLRPGGLIAVEHSDNQGGADGVPGLIEATATFHTITDHPDFTGRPRFTTALRN